MIPSQPEDGEEMVGYSVIVSSSVEQEAGKAFQDSPGFLEKGLSGKAPLEESLGSSPIDLA